MMDTDSFYWWLAGIVDGEGCISPGDKIYSKKRKNGYVQLQRTFMLQISNNDFAMLAYIKERIGVGGIYPIPRTCFNYTLTQRDKLLELAKLLLPKLRHATKIQKCSILIENLEKDLGVEKSNPLSAFIQK